MSKKYYLGLDCGTASVGWAVTDQNYHILRAKGNQLWGVRLFETANTAAERRVFRTTRRRLRRTRQRLKLLETIFADEISQVDKEFYRRLHESFYRSEDKNLDDSSKNTLFNDKNFHDQDFHKTYPTIWHLRQSIISATPDQHFDIRLYFLAIHHIYKNRGHFLYEDHSLGNDNNINFTELYQDFYDLAQNCNINLVEDAAAAVERIITDQSMNKPDKKKALAEVIFSPDDSKIHSVGASARSKKSRQRSADSSDEDNENFFTAYSDFAGLLIGCQVNLAKIFTSESTEKFSYSFAKGDFEEKLPDIEETVGTNNLDLIIAMKKIYDYGVLRNLLGVHANISAAMVANYDQHQTDLKELKKLLRPFPEDYHKIFRAEIYDEKNPSYNAYIGKAFTADKSGRKSTKRISQEDSNKYLKKVLESHQITGDFYNRACEGELLPKQRGQAKGTIPQQLHHAELEKIVEKLCADFPSFAAKVPGEPAEYNTKAKKLLSIHSFKIPYYCGPLVKRKFDNDGHEISGGKSRFSWADAEISELVYPWNFKKLAGLDARADNFIRRMTNQCTYLLGEDVLPKSSLIYQKYLVLNQLNNLTINGKRISDVKMKQKIFDEAFDDSNTALFSNFRLKAFKKWLIENQFITASDDLGGIDSAVIFPRLKTQFDLIKILGLDYKKYSRAQLEKVIEAITILGEEKSMLAKKITEILHCDEPTATKLAKLSYKDWGRFSAKLLTGLRANLNGRDLTILDALYETNYNFMELLSKGFDQKIEEYNRPLLPTSEKLTYADVQKLYCSPAVKRSIWQTVKIVNELTSVLKTPPEKIFLEVTRENEDDETKNRKSFDRLARKQKLLISYQNLKEKNSELLNALKSTEDRELQSKKLFLYFSQMGRCAYCGSHIHLEDLETSAYDIDHIYPRSKTKDDSITNNLVLVDAKCNRIKSNQYPVPDDWRQNMHGTWLAWRTAGLITQEKFNRLTCSTPLTADELGKFIARQIIETSQSVKAIRNLLQTEFPQSKIVLVKAKQVSEFRQQFGYDRKDRSGRVVESGRYEFIKLRELNDFHHAKDAYLNIVVGNVMNSTFSDDPAEWVRRQNGADYTINPKVIFRASEVYTTQKGQETDWPKISGWDFQNSIDVISSTLKRNDILWTRMTQVRSGKISDLQPVGKSEKTEGILPLKQTKRLQSTEKYGGYNSISGAYFALIELPGKKDENIRKLVQVPIIHKNNPAKYFATEYKDAKIIIPKIPIYAYCKRNGFPMHLRGRTNDKVSFMPAVQVMFSPDLCDYVKKVVKVANKLKSTKDKYNINKYDEVSKNENEKLFDAFLEKLNAFRKMPTLGSKIDDIISHRADFLKLTLEQQCKILSDMLIIFGCNAGRCDLSIFVPGTTQLGNASFSSNLNNSDSFLLINQSPTGLFTTEIDLKAVQPGDKVLQTFVKNSDQSEEPLVKNPTQPNSEKAK